MLATRRPAMYSQLTIIFFYDVTYFLPLIPKCPALIICNPRRRYFIPSYIRFLPHVFPFTVLMSNITITCVIDAHWRLPQWHLIVFHSTWFLIRRTSNISSHKKAVNRYSIHVNGRSGPVVQWYPNECKDVECPKLLNRNTVSWRRFRCWRYYVNLHEPTQTDMYKHVDNPHTHA